MRIKEIREQKSISRKNLSKIVGISKTHLRLIEERKVWPDSQMLIKICRTLNTNIGHLFFEPKSEIEKILGVYESERTIEDMVKEAIKKNIISYAKASEIIGYKLNGFSKL